MGLGALPAANLHDTQLAGRSHRCSWAVQCDHNELWTAGYLVGVALFLPGVGVVVVAIAFPEAEPILGEEFQAAQPLGALPEEYRAAHWRCNPVRNGPGQSPPSA